MVAVIGVSSALGGFGLGFSVNTPTWWVTRPAYLAVLILVTAPFVLLFARFERPWRDFRPAPAAWRPVLAAAAICAGLGLLARYGVADESGPNIGALALPFIGVVIGGLVGSGSSQAESSEVADVILGNEVEIPPSTVGEAVQLPR